MTTYLLIGSAIAMLTLTGLIDWHKKETRKWGEME